MMICVTIDLIWFGFEAALFYGWGKKRDTLGALARLRK